ncbi:MAG: hypothetical protein ACI9VM_000107 [Candidatus Azotimanducaceae bacterium]|jgi:hypothetical protein
MKSYYNKTDDMELGCHIDEGGVIRVHMEGNLSSDNYDELLIWAESLRGAMRTAKAHDPKRVYCIINVVGRVDADLHSLKLLIDLVRHNKDYATRTGVYGANLIMRGFVDIAVKTAQRKNMKAFTTIDQAEKWIFTGKKDGVLE